MRWSRSRINSLPAHNNASTRALHNSVRHFLWSCSHHESISYNTAAIFSCFCQILLIYLIIYPFTHLYYGVVIRISRHRNPKRPYTQCIVCSASTQNEWALAWSVCTFPLSYCSSPSPVVFIASRNNRRTTLGHLPLRVGRVVSPRFVVTLAWRTQQVLHCRKPPAFSFSFYLSVISV